MYIVHVAVAVVEACGGSLGYRLWLVNDDDGSHGRHYGGSHV